MGKKNKTLLQDNKLRVTLGGVHGTEIRPWHDFDSNCFLLGSVLKFCETNGDEPAYSGLLQKALSFVVMCHMCGTSRNLGNCNLVKNSCWTSINCKRCKVPRKSFKWLCRCDVPWHGCKIHRVWDFLCKSLLLDPKQATTKRESESNNGLRPTKLARKLVLKGNLRRSMTNTCSNDQPSADKTRNVELRATPKYYSVYESRLQVPAMPSCEAQSASSSDSVGSMHTTYRNPLLSASSIGPRGILICIILYTPKWQRPPSLVTKSVPN